MRIATCLLFVVAVPVFPEFVQAQSKPKGNAQEEKQEAAREKAAKAAVDDANGKAQSAAKAAQTAAERAAKAKSAWQSAVQGLDKIRDTLERKHDQKANVPEARAEVKQAEDELDRVRQPVLEALREKTEYRSAVAAAQTAQSRIRALGTGVSAVDKAKILEATLEPGRMERAALDADPQGKLASAKLAAAQAGLKSAIAARDRLVEADPVMRQARTAATDSQNAHEAAVREAAQTARDAAEAAQRVAQARANLVQLQRAEAIDDARDRAAQQAKNKKNDKNKKPGRKN